MTVDANNVRERLGKHILADGLEPVMDIEKSHGSWLVDERNGSKYLDMFSMYASGAVFATVSVRAPVAPKVEQLASKAIRDAFLHPRGSRI